MMVVHGDRDAIVPVAVSRALAAAAAARDVPCEYLELAGADHLSVVARALPRVLDFLERQALPGG